MRFHAGWWSGNRVGDPLPQPREERVGSEEILGSAIGGSGSCCHLELRNDVQCAFERRIGGHCFGNEILRLRLACECRRIGMEDFVVALQRDGECFIRDNDRTVVRARGPRKLLTARLAGAAPPGSWLNIALRVGEELVAAPRHGLRIDDRSGRNAPAG